MKAKRYLMLPAVLTILSAIIGCSSGGGGGAAPPTTPPSSPAITSSGTSSGSTAVFVDEVTGVSRAATPGSAGGGISGQATVALLTLPTVGNVVGAVTELQTDEITTSLTSISGTTVDPAHDIGMAFDYNNANVSFFQISTLTEVAFFDTGVTSTIFFSGGGGKIVGAIMNPDTQTVIIATADGYKVIDYSTPAMPAESFTIPNYMSDPSGIELNENFGFHPALEITGDGTRDLILSGGMGDGGVNSLELADSRTGDVFKPDAATQALFTHSSYIDAVSVDVNYHVAVLAPEFDTKTVLVDLSKLSLDTGADTFSLPPSAVNEVDIGAFEMTNISVESSSHLVMLGEGYGGTKFLVGELNDPAGASGLGFARLLDTPVQMPSSTSGSWSGSRDPHGTGAYVTGVNHDTKPSTAMGVWAGTLGYGNPAIAVIDLDAVLTGALADPAGYDPTAATPYDIGYFEITPPVAP